TVLPLPRRPNSVLTEVQRGMASLDNIHKHVAEMSMRSRQSSFDRCESRGSILDSPMSTCSTPNLEKEIQKNVKVMARLQHGLEERLHRQQHQQVHHQQQYQQPPQRRDAPRPEPVLPEDSHYYVRPPSEITMPIRSARSERIEVQRAKPRDERPPMTYPSSSDVHNKTVPRLDAEDEQQPRTGGLVFEIAKNGREPSTRMADLPRICSDSGLNRKKTTASSAPRIDRIVMNDRSMQATADKTGVSSMPGHLEYSTQQPSITIPPFEQLCGGNVKKSSSLPVLPRQPSASSSSAGRDLFGAPMDVDAIPKKKRFPESTKATLAGVRFRETIQEERRRTLNSARKTTAAKLKPARKSVSASPKQRTVPFLVTSNNTQTSYSFDANRQQVLALLKQYFPSNAALRHIISSTVPSTRDNILRPFTRICRQEMEELDEKYKAEYEEWQKTEDFDEKIRLDHLMDRQEREYDKLRALLDKTEWLSGPSRPLSTHTDNGGIVHQLKTIQLAIQAAFAITA
ncbi:unnamed protein product, partial [Mesorhabditis spiculigera]